MIVETDFTQPSDYSFAELINQSQPDPSYLSIYSEFVKIVKVDGKRTTAIIDIPEGWSYPWGIAAVHYDRVDLQEPVDSVPGYEIVLDEAQIEDYYQLIDKLNYDLKVYLEIEKDIPLLELPVVQQGETVLFDIPAIEGNLVWFNKMTITLRRFSEESLGRRIPVVIARGFNFTPGIKLKEE